MAPKFPPNPGSRLRSSTKRGQRTGQGLEQYTQLSPATAGLWGPGAPGSAETKEPKALCPEMAAGPDLLQQTQQNQSPLAKMPHERIAQRCRSPSLQNHRHFPCSGSWRDVDTRGARQGLAPTVDLSGNGEGAPMALAPAWAQPGQYQPSVPLQLGWEGWSWESIYPFPSCFHFLS